MDCLPGARRRRRRAWARTPASCCTPGIRARNLIRPMARAQQNPDDQYIAIYSLIQQADALQAADQPRSALAGYTQALAELQKFQKVFPDWDSKIVSFRLNYLTEKINGLAAQFPAASKNETPTNAPPAPTNAAVNPMPPAANPRS